MNIYDLHTHTTSSDGLLSPSELINKAIEVGLHGIAITDHDSIASLEYAVNLSNSKDGFKVIPGIELSCVHASEEVHILGYFIDFNDYHLRDLLKLLMTKRWERGEKILEKLVELGVDLPIKAIIKESEGNGFIGRATIARKIVEYGYSRNISEAFDLYLNQGKPAYVERYKLRIEEAINIIHQIGGISVLAHPGLLLNRDTVTICIKEGIMGLECKHSKHSREDDEYFSKVCKDKGLIATGGSDYHGDEDILGTLTVDIDCIPEFKERL